MGSRSILIIEDDADIRENLRDILHDEGYRVADAANGAEALQIMRASDDQPGLVLLDMMMPVMDGKTFLKELSQDPALCDVPVVVLSAATRATGPNIKASIKKPLELDELLKAANQFCLP